MMIEVGVEVEEVLEKEEGRALVNQNLSHKAKDLWGPDTQSLYLKEQKLLRHLVCIYLTGSNCEGCDVRDYNKFGESFISRRSGKATKTTQYVTPQSQSQPTNLHTGP